MAATLKHHSATLTGTGATSLVPAVAANRALVCRVVVAASGSSNLTITVGDVIVCNALPMTAGQVYTEHGVVVTTGETVTVTASVANILTAHAFGEEVDQ